jgi:hypothetical protein
MAQKNSAFEQADADLRAEANTASVAIENLTNKSGCLRLSPGTERDSGVEYELLLIFRPSGPVNDAPRQADRTKSYVLGTFFLPWQGYPIRTGHLQLPDRSAITAYFVEMARAPTSPLVNYIAFNMRRQEQAVAGG